MVTDGLAAACPISPLNHAGPTGLEYDYYYYYYYCGGRCHATRVRCSCNAAMLGPPERFELSRQQLKLLSW